MGRSPFNERQEELSGSVLCRDHAAYYELSRNDVTICEEPAEGELIDCEECSMAKMRRLGML
jgi:hypothetical protein